VLFSIIFSPMVRSIPPNNHHHLRP
jgi:hypothetical protein